MSDQLDQNIEKQVKSLLDQGWTLKKEERAASIKSLTQQLKDLSFSELEDLHLFERIYQVRQSFEPHELGPLLVSSVYQGSWMNLASEKNGFDHLLTLVELNPTTVGAALLDTSFPMIWLSSEEAFDKVAGVPKKTPIWSLRDATEEVAQWSETRLALQEMEGSEVIQSIQMDGSKSNILKNHIGLSILDLEDWVNAIEKEVYQMESSVQKEWVLACARAHHKERLDQAEALGVSLSKSTPIEVADLWLKLHDNTEGLIRQRQLEQSKVRATQWMQFKALGLPALNPKLIDWRKMSASGAAMMKEQALCGELLEESSITLWAALEMRPNEEQNKALWDQSSPLKWAAKQGLPVAKWSVLELCQMIETCCLELDPQKRELSKKRVELLLKALPGLVNWSVEEVNKVQEGRTMMQWCERCGVEEEGWHAALALGGQFLAQDQEGQTVLMEISQKREGEQRRRLQLLKKVCDQTQAGLFEKLLETTNRGGTNMWHALVQHHQLQTLEWLKDQLDHEKVQEGFLTRNQRGLLPVELLNPQEMVDSVWVGFIKLCEGLGMKWDMVNAKGETPLAFLAQKGISKEAVAYCFDHHDEALNKKEGRGRSAIDYLLKREGSMASFVEKRMRGSF